MSLTNYTPRFSCYYYEPVQREEVDALGWGNDDNTLKIFKAVIDYILDHDYERFLVNIWCSRTRFPDAVGDHVSIDFDNPERFVYNDRITFKPGNWLVFIPSDNVNDPPKVRVMTNEEFVERYAWDMERNGWS